MTVELERLETKFALAGEASERDLDLYIRAAGNLRRLLEAIGLQRRQREVVLDPLSYARQLSYARHASEDAPEDDEEAP